MKVVNYLLYGLATIIITSCGVQKSEYDKLKTENENLKKENDELKNGADRLIAKVQKEFNEKNYAEARKDIELLASKHPESSKNTEFRSLLKEIVILEAEQQKQKEAAEKEKIRLENLNNTGIWENDFYTDNFGDITNKGFIGTKQLISGTFSNSATQNSDLTVQFLISKATDITIKLYEYGRNNPVKAYRAEYYTAIVKDCEGKKTELRAVNYSDRLHFEDSNGKKLHNILLKGGQVQFHIYEDENSINTYDFKIENADWYENAYKKLTGS